MKNGSFYLAFLLWLLFFERIDATPIGHLDSITANFYKQLLLYPQEKVYVQTDKSYYITGEDIWFRAHLTDAQTHQPDTTSRYVYGELINPFNHVVKRVKIKPDQGVYHGHIPLTNDLPEGDYQLRFYTRTMEQVGEEYFFKKKIRIGGAYSALYGVEALFNYQNENKKLLLTISLKEFSGNGFLIPDKVEIDNGKGYAKEFSSNKKETISFTLTNSDTLTSSLLVTCEYQGKIHKQFLSIPAPAGDFDVTFFPEGGQIPAGVFTRVAFKSVNSDGLGEDIHGVIVNEQRETLTHFSSVYKGMGCIFYKTEEGENLYVICKNKENLEKTFKLPKAIPQALSLHTTYHRNNWYISINKSDKHNLPNISLLVLCRGIPIYSTVWNWEETAVILPEKELPSGIIHFLLIDKNRNPLSERLVFNKNNIDLVNVDIQTDKEKYSIREKVDISVQLKDYQDVPLSGNLSLSITDNKDFYPDTTVNIMTTLLLTSDLKGYIESPAYYFNENHTQANEHLDILLMTQGWRRYNIEKVLNGLPEESKIPKEWGQEIKGNIKGGLLLNKPVANYQVSLFAAEFLYYNETVTDENGEFIFNNFEFPDTTQFVIQGKTPKGKSHLDLWVKEETFPENRFLLPTSPTTPEEKVTFETYTKKADQHFVNHHGIRTIHLEDIIVTAPKINRNRSMFSNAGNKKYVRKYLERFHTTNIQELIKFIPSLNISGEIGDPTITIARNNRTITSIPSSPSNGFSSSSSVRGGGSKKIMEDDNQILILVDNIKIPPQHIHLIPSNIIEEIEVVDGPHSAIFGLAGYKGAILITTKQEIDIPEETFSNIKYINPLGYQISKEFYSPRYEVKEDQDFSKPDLRTTLYWKPYVQASEEGIVTFDFYTADFSPDYSMIIEGVTPEGKIIYAIKQIGGNK